MHITFFLAGYWLWFSLFVFNSLSTGQAQPWPSQDPTGGFNQGDPPLLFFLFWVMSLSGHEFFCNQFFLIPDMIDYCVQREEKKREVTESEVSLQRIQMKYKVCMGWYLTSETVVMCFILHFSLLSSNFAVFIVKQQRKGYVVPTDISDYSVH